MPRRRSRKLLITGVVTPTDLSKTVIDKYVSEAKENLAAWSRNYRGQISAYVGDKKRQDVAQAKLAAWYDLYLTEIYPKVKEVFATARAEYIKKIAKPYGGGVTTPPGGGAPTPPA
jgi:hypothetical protein